VSRRIERIYVVGYKRDLRFTRCCVVSIRRWYPDVPIALVKDELAGPYDTKELERGWNVEVLRTEARCFGWGMSRLEPLLLPGGERCLILDSDTAFVGRVLDELERFDEDFVVEGWDHEPDEIRANYFDPEAVMRAFPGFEFPGWVFNSGQIVATTGLLRREDFEPLLAFREPRECRYPEIFRAGEQGVLNYVLLSQAQRGKLRIRRHRFMKWAPAVRADAIRTADLEGDGHPFLLHWAGRKAPVLAAHPQGHVLRHFETRYYRQLHGRRAPERRQRPRTRAPHQRPAR